MLLQELSSDPQSAPPLMDRDNLDLIFVNRLIESPPAQHPQQPLHYLLACFGRSSSELRSMSPRNDAATQQQLQGTIMACRELIVQYAALILTDAGVIPQVGETGSAHTGSNIRVAATPLLQLRFSNNCHCSVTTHISYGSFRS